MGRIPVAGDIYQHFKGQLYRVVTLAEHTETGEQLVIYQALYGEYGIYARPLGIFMSEVDHERYPDAVKQRFTLIPEPEMLPAGSANAGAASPFNIPLPSGSDQAGSGGNATAPSEAVQPVLKSAAADMQQEVMPDPVLLAFLDADSYERKLEIFSTLAGRADDHMLNTIAASLDLELSEGSTQERYDTLKNCLLTLERYECTRLR